MSQVFGPERSGDICSRRAAARGDGRAGNVASELDETTIERLDELVGGLDMRLSRAGRSGAELIATEWSQRLGMPGDIDDLPTQPQGQDRRRRVWPGTADGGSDAGATRAGGALGPAIGGRCDARHRRAVLSFLLGS